MPFLRPALARRVRILSRTTPNRTQHASPSRLLTTFHGAKPPTLRWGRILTGTLLALGLSPWYTSHSYLDTSSDPPPGPSTTQDPLPTLLRAYFVYTMCSVPALVDASPRALQLLSAVPGLRQLTEAFVRVTFFDHFVGGDTASDTLPLLRALRAQNKGVLLAYSVEVDEDEATASPASSSHTKSMDMDTPHQRIADEMIHCIDVAADFEDSLHSPPSARRTWVAVKMTALLPNARALIHLSTHLTRTRPALTPPVPFPGCPDPSDLDALSAESTPQAPLTTEDITQLHVLHDALVRICTRAQERGVKVIIDAEYSWYQPAIDAFTLALMREFNALPSSSSPSTSSVQPLVYGTYQAYLRRTPLHLTYALADARAHNYALGVKLVRGAYHPHELAAFYAAKASSASDVTTSSSASHSPSSSSSAAAPTSPSPTSILIPSESLTILAPSPVPPVWSQKDETDMAYNDCVALLILAAARDAAVPSSSSLLPSLGWFSRLWPSKDNRKTDEREHATRPPGIGLLFGTHNRESCGIVLDEMVANGLAVRRGDAGAFGGLRKAALQGTEDGNESKQGGTEEEGKIEITPAGLERVAIGQLYGMSDDLTASLVARTTSASPFVIKYVPYGALSEVMPYLSRRAIENKSILGSGGAARERRLAGDAIRRRVGGIFGLGG